MIQSMEILTNGMNRRCVGVNTDNAYIFARTNDAEGPHRGSDCLHDFAIECDATYPETLTATTQGWP